MPTLPKPQPMMRDLRATDLDAAAALSGVFGWPHRVADWEFARRLGDGVCLEADGRLLGTAMAWKLGAEHGTFGLLIVAPDQQGNGFGRRLMEAALDRLGARSVLLHATPDGVPLYRRLGFAPGGAVRQHQGVVQAAMLPPTNDGVIQRASGADLTSLTALDGAATGMARGALLAALLAEADCAVLERAGIACGFAMRRRFGRGEVIGPVIAPDGAGARALILHLIGQAHGGFLRIDVPETSGLSQWLTTLGLAQVDTVTRMVRGVEPVRAPTSCFALVSQAFG